MTWCNLVSLCLHTHMLAKYTNAGVWWCTARRNLLIIKTASETRHPQGMNVAPAHLAMKWLPGNHYLPLHPMYLLHHWKLRPWTRRRMEMDNCMNSQSPWRAMMKCSEQGHAPVVDYQYTIWICSFLSRIVKYLLAINLSVCFSSLTLNVSSWTKFFLQIII